MLDESEKKDFFLKVHGTRGQQQLSCTGLRGKEDCSQTPSQKAITFHSLPLFLAVAAVYQRMMEKSKCIIIDTSKLKFLQGHQEVHVLLYSLEPNEAVCDFTEHWRQMITAVLQVDGDSKFDPTFV